MNTNYEILSNLRKSFEKSLSVKSNQGEQTFLCCYKFFDLTKSGIIKNAYEGVIKDLQTEIS